MRAMLVPALLWTSAIGCGLMAGVYFAFSAFIMTSLGRIAPGIGHGCDERDDRRHREVSVHACLHVDHAHGSQPGGSRRRAVGAAPARR